MLINVKVDYENINFRIDREYPEIPVEFKDDMNNHWQYLINKNPRVFNGELYGSYSIATTDQSDYTVVLSRTNYKILSYIRSRNVYLKGGLSAGVGIILYEPSTDSFVLVERSSEVEYGKNKLDLIGGFLDYSENNDIKSILYDVAMTEIKEEATVKSILNKMKPVHIYYSYDSNKNLFLRFTFVVAAEIKVSTNWENNKIVKVPVKDFNDFVKRNSVKFYINEIPEMVSMFSDKIANRYNINPY